MNDKKEDKKVAAKGKKGAKGKDDTKQDDAKEENHSENGDTKTNEVVYAVHNGQPCCGQVSHDPPELLFKGYGRKDTFKIGSLPFFSSFNYLF